MASCTCATPVPTADRNTLGTRLVLLVLGFFTCGVAWLGLIGLMVKPPPPRCRVCHKRIAVH